jgi:hypothetical protein
MAVVLLWTPPTLYLFWLVIHREPLPIADLRTSALVTTLFCALTIASLVIVHRLPLLSFPSLFLGVTFLFTCSPLILYQIQGLDAFSQWEWVDIPSVLVSMPIVMLAFSSFLLGSSLVRTFDGTTGVARTDSDPPSAEERALRTLGFAIYAVCGVIALASTIAGGSLRLAFEGGYSAYRGARRAGEISQVVGVSLVYLLPWSLLILAATSRDRRSRRQVVLLAIPFFVVMLAAGSRGASIATMAVLASAAYLSGARINWRRTFALAALIAFLIPTVLNLRKAPISQWSGETFRSAVSNDVQATTTYGRGPIEGFLSAMSNSFQTLMATVKVVPDQQGFHYGTDYLSSLNVAIPFRAELLPLIGVRFDRQPPSQWILQSLHPGRRAGPGYMQIAEAYLQFGAFGVVGLYLLLGSAWTWLWRSMASKGWDRRALALTLIVMMESLVWVRNSSTDFVRPVSWGWIIAYAIPWFLVLQRRARSIPRVPMGSSREGAPT